MTIESTGEKLTIEQREEAARVYMINELYRLESRLLTLGEKRAARFCYKAIEELRQRLA